MAGSCIGGGRLYYGYKMVTMVMVIMVMVTMVIMVIMVIDNLYLHCRRNWGYS